MAVQNEHTTWTFLTKNDLSDTTRGTGDIAKAVSGQTGDIAANGKVASGILTYCTASGNHDATYGDAGKIKYTAGAAITSADMQLTVAASGYVTTADSGDWIIGRSIGDSVASGALGIGHFNFATPYFVVDCTFLGN